MYGDLEVFSPFGKDYCLYFYALMIFSFILLIVAIFQVVFMLLKGKIGVGLAVTTALTPFLVYFTNRLMYSICVRALN